jgi:alkanesulfonate monooxygenase SsuD/methylene tetrahydromethanopterin reductase-like flavin-dependent oxidoreductase (luciferase family)
MPSHPTPGLAPRTIAPFPSLPTRPGLVGVRLSATEQTELDWHRIDETWTAAGEEHVVAACWLSDHLSDASRDRQGPAFESLTLAAALAHRVTGKWIGIAVASATFRHPALLAKAATVLDNVTAGRFILGLGSGWHEGEHDAFGISLPPLPERFDRLESQLRVLRALFSERARQTPGVTLDDPFYPLHDATNEPGPVRPGGPLLWLGAGKPRGLGLMARYACGSSGRSRPRGATPRSSRSQRSSTAGRRPHNARRPSPRRSALWPPARPTSSSGCRRRSRLTG